MSPVIDQLITGYSSVDTKGDSITYDRNVPVCAAFLQPGAAEAQANVPQGQG